MTRDRLAGRISNPFIVRPDHRLTPDRAPSGGRRVKCPACGASTTWQDNPQRPFCSLTCRLADLGQWLDERYRLPGGDFSPETDDVP